MHLGTILDYIDWRGDLSLEESPFCEVDNLIMTQLSFMELDKIADMETRRQGIKLSEAVRLYLEKYNPEKYSMGVLIPEELPELFLKAANSRRFGDMRLFKYVSVLDTEYETQFAALSIDLGDGSVYVAYRGTDDSIVGWKENFNMSFMEAIPAQRLALKYLEAVAEHSLYKLRVGGHSKGGNLAIYASANASKRIKKRIINVYNNDGPGFNKSLDDTDISDKIITIVPSFSVVGLLLEHGKVDKVIKSTGGGVWQHDPCTWEVLGNSFVLSDGLARESGRIEKTLKACVAELSAEERRDMVEALYKVFTVNHAETLSDIAGGKMEFIRSLGKLDEKTRNIMISTGKLLLREGIRAKREEKKEKPAGIFKRGRGERTDADID